MGSTLLEASKNAPVFGSIMPRLSLQFFRWIAEFEFFALSGRTATTEPPYCTFQWKELSSFIGKSRSHSTDRPAYNFLTKKFVRRTAQESKQSHLLKLYTYIYNKNFLADSTRKLGYSSTSDYPTLRPKPASDFSEACSDTSSDTVAQFVYLPGKCEDIWPVLLRSSKATLRYMKN